MWRRRIGRRKDVKLNQRGDMERSSAKGERWKCLPYETQAAKEGKEEERGKLDVDQILNVLKQITVYVRCLRQMQWELT